MFEPFPNYLHPCLMSKVSTADASSEVFMFIESIPGLLMLAFLMCFNDGEVNVSVDKLEEVKTCLIDSMSFDRGSESSVFSTSINNFEKIYMIYI